METRKETQVFRGMVLLLLPTMPPEHPNLLAVLAGMPATSLLCKVRLAPARQSVARLTAHPSISTLHRAQPLGARTSPPVPPLSAGLAGCAPDTYQSPHLHSRSEGDGEHALQQSPRAAAAARAVPVEWQCVQCVQCAASASACACACAYTHTVQAQVQRAAETSHQSPAAMTSTRPLTRRAPFQQSWRAVSGQRSSLGWGTAMLGSMHGVDSRPGAGKNVLVLVDRTSFN